MRERGLKLLGGIDNHPPQIVAPRAGAWIETMALFTPPPLGLVAPRAGAWIETINESMNSNSSAESLPVRERGLKL